MPGPGEYDGKLMKSNQSIRMGGRLENPEGLKVPGPGVNFIFILVL